MVIFLLVMFLLFDIQKRGFSRLLTLRRDLKWKPWRGRFEDLHEA